MTVARQQPATGARPAARLSAKRREAIAGYLFLLPDAAGLLVFIGLPMLLAFVISTFDVDGFGNFRFAGAANYMRMWKDPLFWQSFRVTVLFAVMLVPALDTLLAIVRRTRAGRSPLSPDKMHLHHRLLQIGHSHRRAVLLIYLWVGIIAFGAAATIFFDPRYTGGVMLAAIVVAVVVTLIPLLRRREDDYEGLYDSK